MLVYWAYSYRPDPSSNEPWTLSAAFLAGSVKTLVKCFLIGSTVPSRSA
jgi:hypothetical protein